MRRHASSAASVLLGAALAAIAFVAKGGSDLATLTGVELALVIACALLIAAAVVHGRRGPLDGGFRHRKRRLSIVVASPRFGSLPKARRTSPPTMSNSSSGNDGPNCSLKSRISV